MTIKSILTKSNTIEVIPVVFVMISLCTSARLSAGTAKEPEINPPTTPAVYCYISTGDNYFLGQWLPVDSKASIEASFDLLKSLGIKRIYWRGLRSAICEDIAEARPANCRVNSFYTWHHQIYKKYDPDRFAVQAAHKRGMEIWGITKLFDWGGAAEAGFENSFPMAWEARLRLEHPEWIPVDKRGVLKQAGPIELAYPEARKALVDLHVKHIKHAGYDGATFMTYSENFNMRFGDEFGYNEPIVKEFKKRYGIDICTEPFTRFASRFDWYRLRGEYVTKFLAELKQQLNQYGIKLGVVINPIQPHYPQPNNYLQPWDVPTVILSAGRIYMDLESWVQQKLVDEFEVYGNCSRPLQVKSIEDMLWIARGTGIQVGFTTSASPYDKQWQLVHEKGAHTIVTLHNDEEYLDSSNIPEQSLAALKSSDELMQMKVLSQIVLGKTKAEVKDVAPLAGDKNIIVRRLALKALGKIGDTNAVPIIEKGLADDENSVRCVAAGALRYVHGSGSAERILETLDKYSYHPLAELAHSSLLAIKPAPRQLLINKAKACSNPMVRKVAIWTLAGMATEELIPVFEKALDDSSQCVGYYAAEGLGNIRKSPEAAKALIKATEHANPVISDKAAAMLGVIASRNEKEIQPLKTAMIAALDKLFAEFADGCKRTDAEWGYRPAGNALVAMGADGKAVLERFMNQTKDFKLAEQAWKALYIRQKPGWFCPVTEKENEEAFKKRPAWLNKTVEKI
ncbi:MAG: HEAT repeat domain-containing protein [Sedimentisphaerales bacterium]|nr:HEAT repeat domain-containing protein [Sedimentisphaerales bacterium]